MKIICLEGPHGCGKTRIIQKIKEAGGLTIDEGFLDMPQFHLHPQSFTMEYMWVAKWVERVLSLRRQYDGVDHSNVIYYADRSPFSVMFYAPNGRILEAAITEQIMELLGLADIDIITVNISVNPEILWKRIQDRLTREPERKAYGEDKYEHMTLAIAFYEVQYTHLWNYTVTNNADADTALKYILDVERDHD